MTTSWRVNSYGYPNPFTTSRAHSAWQKFETFLAQNSYRKLKDDWDRRGLDPHAVESWKANFEECGLLYLISRDDTIQITPGGRQLKAAADAGNEREFAWIGTNLLVRYRLRGTTGRRPRKAPHDTSDLMPYWLVLAAALELDGLWQTELFRIIAGVFNLADAPAAIDRIRSSREGTFNPMALPNLATPGAAYNALNQVAVKAGLNQMTLVKGPRPSPYDVGTQENYWRVPDGYRPIVELALGGTSTPANGCSIAPTSWIERMPSAPLYEDEQAHFTAVGAPVTPLADAEHAASTAEVRAPTAIFGTEQVHLLTVGKHCSRPDSFTIEGATATLCVLAKDRRIVLNEDLSYTYLVKGKTLLFGPQVRVHLQRARPIQNAAYVRTLFEGESGGRGEG